MPQKKNHRFVDKMRILRENAEKINSQVIDILGTDNPIRAISPPPRQSVRRSKTMPTEKRPVKISKRQQAASLSSITKPKSPSYLKVQKEFRSRSPSQSSECYNQMTSSNYGNPPNTPYHLSAPNYSGFRNSAQSIPEMADYQHLRNPWDSTNQSSWSLYSPVNSPYTSNSQIVGLNYPSEFESNQWDNQGYVQSFGAESIQQNWGQRQFSTESSASVPEILINGEVEEETRRLQILELDDVIDVLNNQ